MAEGFLPDRQGFDRAGQRNFEKINALLKQMSPPGKVDTYAGATAPDGWLICDGSAVSRTDYADLFAAIGTTYGPGDGSTTFNLPDGRGRVIVGRHASQSEFDTLGETGGARTHTLLLAETPAHDHTFTLPRRPADDTGLSTVTLQGNVADTSGAFTTSSVGGGGAHNNLQPYVVMNHIIKI